MSLLRGLHPRTGRLLPADNVPRTWIDRPATVTGSTSCTSSIAINEMTSVLEPASLQPHNKAASIRNNATRISFPNSTPNGVEDRPNRRYGESSVTWDLIRRLTIGTRRPFNDIHDITRENAPLVLCVD